MLRQYSFELFAIGTSFSGFCLNWLLISRTYCSAYRYLLPPACTTLEKLIFVNLRLTMSAKHVFLCEALFFMHWGSGDASTSLAVTQSLAGWAEDRFVLLSLKYEGTIRMNSHQSHIKI